MLFYQGKELDLDNKILGTSKDIKNTRFCLAGAPKGVTGLSVDCDYFIFKEDVEEYGMTLNGIGIYSRKYGKVIKPSRQLQIESSHLVPLVGDVCTLEYKDKFKPNAPLWSNDGQYFEKYIDHINYYDVEDAVKIILQNNMKLPVSHEQFYNIVSESRRKIAEEKMKNNQKSDVEKGHSHRR